MIDIKTIEGDITEFPEGIDVILQGCNIRATQGAGLAKTLSQKYPSVLQADIDRHKRYKIRGLPPEYLLGKYSKASVDLGTKYRKIIVNLYQQDLTPCITGVNLSYDALYSALYKFNEEFKNVFMPLKIGIPDLIGCGLAGGEREIVLAIIKTIFKDSKHQIILVKHNPTPN